MDLFPNQRPGTRNQGPVECLGITFPNDEGRRKYFLGLLRAGLQELRENLSVSFTSLDDTYNRLKSLHHWPLGTAEQIRELTQRIAEASRSINQEPGTTNQELLVLYEDEVGFPIGSDEDILALSDPPYYTDCLNPFVRDFVAHWRTEQQGLRKAMKTLSPQSYHREPFAALTRFGAAG